MDKEKLIEFIKINGRLSKPRLLKAIAMGRFDKNPCDVCNGNLSKGKVCRACEGVPENLELSGLNFCPYCGLRSSGEILENWRN
jgi:hypothetical protein